MKLEDEIQQKEFASEHHKALVNILFTAYHFQSIMTEKLKPYDITRQQYNVLRILRGQHPKPVSVNTVRERMLDKLSDASRIIDRLVAKKLVSRTVSTRDRRAVDINICQSGLDLLDSMAQAILEAEAGCHQLTEKELQQLNHFLDTIRI
ncbi:MAG: MarR family transcriptional regulator [Cyclobacteriaceae bacterium]|nr:MarR family transcriptional regulator [Cyclobacteriaceae bacterium]